jgi:hypothetical protein
MLPLPELAIIFVFPMSDAYKVQKANEESIIRDYKGSGKGEDVM